MCFSDYLGADMNEEYKAVCRKLEIECEWATYQISSQIEDIDMIYRCGYLLERTRQKAKKYLDYFNLLDQILACKERDYKIADYFAQNHIESVAIYGMGKIGKHLKYELEKNKIQRDYVIDERDDSDGSDRKGCEKEIRYKLRDKLPDADIVIVTPMEEFEFIKNRITSNNKSLNVISIKELMDILRDKYC